MTPLTAFYWFMAIAGCVTITMLLALLGMMIHQIWKERPNK